MKLQNARILITGGSLGIGKATARLLIENGAKVAITGRNAKNLQATATEIGAFPIVADVAKSEDVERTYKEVLKSFGGLECLINNAGIGSRRSLLEITEEDLLRVWSVNVLGAALMGKHAAQIFMKNNYGNIVNIASTAALRGYENGTSYVASKFALRGMTECWRAELRKYNIRVMLINPSEVTTAFGSADRVERGESANKLRGLEIAHTIKAALEMDDRGFIPELSVFATNPW